MSAEIVIRRDVSALVREIVPRYSGVADAAIRDHGAFYLTLSGGETPKPLYEALARTTEPKLPWAQTDLFWNDERMVPPEHPESNFGLADRTLISRVPLARAHVHRILGEAASPLDAALAYEHMLHDHFPAGPLGPPSRTFDLLLLGLGPDGHTASLFPEDPGAEETTRWVTPVPIAGEPPMVPRVSLTPAALNRAGAAFFLVTGRSKAGIVRRVLDEHGRGATHLPAARIRPQGPVTFFLDEAAASELPTASERH